MQKLFKTFSGLNDEVPISVDYEGVSFRFMDPSRVLMADVSMPKYFFSEYEVGGVDAKTRMVTLPQTVYINVKDILYALEGAPKSADVAFELKEYFKSHRVENVEYIRNPEKCPKCGKPTTNNQLPPDKRGKKGNRYKCSCGWRGKVRARSRKVKVDKAELEEDKSSLLISVGREKYSFKVMDASNLTQIPTLDNLRFDAKVMLTYSGLVPLLKKFSKKFENAMFIATNEAFTVKVESDVGSGETTFKRFDDNLIELDAQKEQKAIYDIANMLKILPDIGDVVELCFSTDMPLRVSFHYTSHAKVDFYLAPKILTDED
jgi:DNA polymerase III sliding clamp (beta) subunit (PCNA family)